jgi:hypothetical protein
MRRSTSGSNEHEVPQGTERLVGNSRRERVSSIGGGNAMFRLRSEDSAVQPACTPGTRRREWTLWTKHESRSPALRCTEAASRGLSRQASGCQLHRFGGAVSVESASRSAHRGVLRYDSSSAGDDNGKRATVAVMRHGCWRGECFEGYEPRCGERSSRFVVILLVARFGWSVDSRVHEADETRAGPGNAANPVRTGMQHARSPERSKPSRW